jgi:hypothetical protein
MTIRYWTGNRDTFWDDYYEKSSDGLERTCTECGEPHMVTREEALQIHVFHEKCLEAIRERHLARRQQMSGDAA